MSRTYSVMQELGREAPPFYLRDANPRTAASDGASVSLDQYADRDVLVVVFTCNHCPYAQHVEGTMIELARSFDRHGVSFVAISSNDPAQYPDDSFDAMAARAEEMDYPFPYLFDETQEVAKAYGAVCTPDVFVFDAERKLVYRGRFDATRPGLGTSTGEELRRALDDLLEHGSVKEPQFPAMGCNIKWKPGNEPHITAGPVPAL